MVFLLILLIGFLNYLPKVLSPVLQMKWLLQDVQIPILHELLARNKMMNPKSRVESSQKSNISAELVHTWYKHHQSTKGKFVIRKRCRKFIFL